MFKHYFEQIQDISIWPIISLCIFFGFFLLMILWLFKVDKRYIKKMKNLPLDEEHPHSPGLTKKILVAVLLLVPQMGYSQSSTTFDQQTLVLWVVTLVLVIAVLVLMVAIYTLNVLRLTVPRKTPVPARRGKWMLQWWDRLNRRVPMEREKDILLDHNYDGIKELDNHLPPWWTALFYFTIAWGVIYMLVYHVFNMAPLPDELYQQEIASAREAAAVRLASQPEGSEAIDENSVTFTDDPAAMESGQKIYDMQCAACHRNDGGGNIGPNLTDNYWIHGGSMSDIFKIIKYGVPQKGMISWEPLLSPVQMRDVSAYILTLVGTNPPNPKEPQGELYENTPEADSP